MLEDLTKEQESQLEKKFSKWVDFNNGGNNFVDKKKVRESVDFIYELGGLNPPEIIIVDGPLDAEKHSKKGEKNDWLGSGFDSGWVAFYEYFIDIGVLKPEEEETKDFLKFKMLLDAGIWATMLFEKTAICVKRPISVKVNTHGDLHCTDGPAILFADGSCQYWLNGVGMEEKHVMTAAEELNVQEIVNEKNVEIRRELIRKIGMERFIQKAGAKVLDKCGDYELLSIHLSDEVSDARYLKMLNPSIGVWHVEGVEGNTVEEAINWRAGNINEKWVPVQLT